LHELRVAAIRESGLNQIGNKQKEASGECSPLSICSTARMPLLLNAPVAVSGTSLAAQINRIGGKRRALLWLSFQSGVLQTSLLVGMSDTFTIDWTHHMTLRSASATKALAAKSASQIKLL
jgi:hypothetical protein